jgi:drug/metabolite transporter (DMT)-like permease
VRPGDLRIGRGELETLVAALFFTMQILTLENPKYRENRGTPVTFLMCAGIAVLFLPISALIAPEVGMLVTAGASWASFGLIAVLAVFCSVGAYLLMNVWQPKVSATEAGYVLFLPAMIAAICGTGYANESLTKAMVTGGGLILAANVLMQWKRKPHPPSIAPGP